MPNLTDTARPAVVPSDPAVLIPASTPDPVTPDPVAPVPAAPGAARSDPARSDPATSVPAAERRPLTRFTKIGLAVVVMLVLAEVAGFTSHYLLVSSRYVSTDNAQIDGTAMGIMAPASGVLTRWTVSQGSTVAPREVLGRIRVGGTAGPQVPIRSPGQGQVARTTATEGRWVTQGTRLATAYNPGDLYVTARVEESAIRDVRLGAAVDISVDAFPGTAMAGVVSGIQASTASEFTVYPNPKDNPVNPRHTDQYVPVQIAFTDSGAVEVLPGMNATVRIHRAGSTS